MLDYYEARDLFGQIARKSFDRAVYFHCRKELRCDCHPGETLPIPAPESDIRAFLQVHRACSLDD